VLGGVSQKMQVFGGIGFAWVISVAFIAIGFRLFESRKFFTNLTAADAAALAVSTASLTLIAGIAWAARTRHFVSNIDGSRPEPGSALDLTLRYVSNTTEQLVLFSLACFSMAAIDETISIRLLPVMGVWFLIARVMFFAGYRINPVWRSVGFAATFHPTITLFAFVFFHFFN
jgi:MAPEG family